MKYLLRRLVLALLALGVVTGGVLLAPGCADDGDDLETRKAVYYENMRVYSKTTAAMWVPPPDDLAELVSKSDIIVVGTVNSVVTSGTLKSYNEADNTRVDEWVEETDAPTTPYVPHTDYLISVETIIMDDGTIAAGDDVVLRMVGRGSSTRVSDNPRIMALPDVGDRRLFTLSENPDGTYGLRGWWSHFVIDGDSVTHADDLRSPVVFSDKTVPAEFIQALRDKVNVTNGN